MAYELRLEQHAIEDLRRMPRADQEFIITKLEKELCQNPFPRGKTIKRLQGLKMAIYRLRINAAQSYRAYYQIFADKTILVLRIVAKKDSEKIIKQF